MLKVKITLVVAFLLAPVLSHADVGICKAEADPNNARWKSNGMPFVLEALAALYDWKIQRTAK